MRMPPRFIRGRTLSSKARANLDEGPGTRGRDPTPSIAGRRPCRIASGGCDRSGLEEQAKRRQFPNGAIPWRRAGQLPESPDLWRHHASTWAAKTVGRSSYAARARRQSLLDIAMIGHEPSQFQIDHGSGRPLQIGDHSDSRKRLLGLLGLSPEPSGRLRARSGPWFREAFDDCTSRSAARSRRPRRSPLGPDRSRPYQVRGEGLSF